MDPGNDPGKTNSQPSTPARCLAAWRRNSAGRNDAEKDFFKKIGFSFAVYRKYATFAAVLKEQTTMSTFLHTYWWRTLLLKKS